jgi:hypothetical protein
MLRQEKNAGLASLSSKTIAMPLVQRNAESMFRGNTPEVQDDSAETSRLKE